MCTSLRSFNPKVCPHDLRVRFAPPLYFDDHRKMELGRWASIGRTSMSDLKDKVAIVTGASKGIGAAIAKCLSVAGAAVVVNYSSS